MNRNIIFSSLLCTLVLSVVGCGSSSSGGSGGGTTAGSATLVSSSSSPSSGDGTVSVSAVTYEDSGLSGVKRVKTKGTVGVINHEVLVYINEASGVIVSASHSWGNDTDASDLCASSCESEATCNGAVTHDSATKKITITNAAMTGSFPGNCNSTVTGEITYRVQ